MKQKCCNACKNIRNDITQWHGYWQTSSICLKDLTTFKFLLIVTCQYTNFVIAIPLKDTQARTIAEALIHRVITIFGIPNLLIVDKDRAFTGEIINLLLQALQCTQKIISPYNHGSLKTEWQIQVIGNIINKQLTDKGEQWPLFGCTTAYAMNTFTSSTLDEMSPFELVIALEGHLILLN